MVIIHCFGPKIEQKKGHLVSRIYLRCPLIELRGTNKIFIPSFVMEKFSDL